LEERPLLEERPSGGRSDLEDALATSAHRVRARGILAAEHRWDTTPRSIETVPAMGADRTGRTRGERFAPARATLNLTSPRRG
jgi:hypothetical protein